MQVKRVPCELGVRAIEAIAPAHELDEQRDGALDESVRVREQRLVLRAGGGARTRCEERAGGGALAVRAGEEVRAGGREWPAVERERVAAIDVEARVREWAEGRNGRGVGGRR